MTLEVIHHVIDGNLVVNDAQKDQAFFHVTFLAANPAPCDPKVFEDKRQGEEGFYIAERAVYLYCPNGYGRTKLTTNFFEAKLNVGATTRNWKTTKERLRLAER